RSSPREAFPRRRTLKRESPSWLLEEPHPHAPLPTGLCIGLISRSRAPRHRTPPRPPRKRVGSSGGKHFLARQLTPTLRSTHPRRCGKLPTRLRGGLGGEFSRDGAGWFATAFAKCPPPFLFSRRCAYAWALRGRS